MESDDVSYPELEIETSAENKILLETVQRFAREVVRPKGIEIDKLADPADAIAADSPYWEVVRTYRELGLHKQNLPAEFGGMQGQVDPAVSRLMRESIAYADCGLNTSLGLGGVFAQAARSEDPELREWAHAYAEDTKGELIGCWAVTEPDHGSDWVMSSILAESDRSVAPNVRAERKGKEFILRGQKSAWVSNGTIATHTSMHVSLDPSLGMGGTGVCILPLDLPGISKGRPLNKIGLRALNQGEIFFEEVVIPEKYMVIGGGAGGIGPGDSGRLITGILAGANTGMAMAFSQLAKAALDEAIAYARQRVQGGVPIFEHQNIKLKLMNMFRMVEASRSLVRYCGELSRQQGPSLVHAVSAKGLATETAFKVASEAIQIFGGNGLSKEYVVEKLFRDARASMIMDGANEVLALLGADQL